MKFWNMVEIKATLEAAGSRFFSAENMRFFASKVYPEVYQGVGGVYFITSERKGFEDTGREYNLRRFLPDNVGTDRGLDIDTVGTFERKIDAVIEAKTLIRGEQEAKS